MRFKPSWVVAAMIVYGGGAMAQAADPIIIDGKHPFQWQPDAPVRPPVEGQTPEVTKGVPIKFGLSKPGYVTLVIEVAEGKRVRNLFGGRKFEAGQHTVYFDGRDETPANFQATGFYEIAGKLVPPGKYQVRGLFRDEITARYEMTAYNNGKPPWPLPDGTGRWIADHTPPSDVLFLPPGRADHRGKLVDYNYVPDAAEAFIPRDQPLVMIGSLVGEAGDNIAYANLNGGKVRGVKGFGIAGGWCGANMLARDAGKAADANVYAYIAVGWKNFLEIRSLPDNQRVLYHEYADEPTALAGAMAVRDGLMVVSLTNQNKLQLIDARSRQTAGQLDVAQPGGVAFADDGRLLVISGKQLLELRLKDRAIESQAVLVGKHLEAPQRVAVAPNGEIFISDWGKSQSVKVFSAEGKPLRAIGKPGGLKLGPYDECSMQQPLGMTFTSDANLWVAENSGSPRRVSIWTQDGKFIRAMYGPPPYGGGGSLDPRDPTRFYMAYYKVGMEFQLDLKRGTDKLESIYCVGEEGERAFQPAASTWHEAPQTPIYIDGHQYMTPLFSGSPGGLGVGSIYLMRDGIAKPVAYAVTGDAWPILSTEPFKGRLLPDVPVHETLCIWSDLNGDSRVDPQEVTAAACPSNCVTMNGARIGNIWIGEDLSITTAHGYRLKVEKFLPGGVPVYDVAKLEKPPQQIDFHWWPYETFVTREGWMISKAEPMRGHRDGKLVWTYPNQWPEMHACFGHGPPLAAPGQLVGTCRLIGHPFKPADGQAGELFALNGYYGQIYLMTSDGLFLTTLFRDMRETGYFNAFASLPKAERGIRMNDVSLQGECFFDTITQTKDGRVFLRVGKSHATLARLEGFETVRRLPPQALEITAAELEKLQ